MTPRLATAILVLLLTAGTTSAASAQPTPPAAADAAMGEPQVIIPAGQDDLLADIAGRGEMFPGACKFSGGQAAGPLIRLTYTCAGGELVFELQHPNDAPSDAITTARFAVVLHSGSPPPGFVDALVARIRSKEGSFAWQWLGGQPRARFRLWTVLLVAAGVLVLAALGRAAWLHGRH